MSRSVRRTRRTAVAAVIALALVGGGVGVAVSRDRRPAPAAAASAGLPEVAVAPSAAPRRTPGPDPTPTAKPTDPLTGGPVSDHGVFAVKVENIAAARPQVGLTAADVVVAEQVEGAQTRLVAVFHRRFPTRLGPVRSARTTDAQLLPLFGRPGLVYSGANRRVQAALDRASLVPVQRETRDPARYAPHDVFVDLRALAATEHVGRARSTGWVFDGGDPAWDDARRAGQPRSRVGHDTFSFDRDGDAYTVRWNGERYVDGDSGDVVTCQNVIVLSVHDHPDGNRDVLGAASVMSDTVGRGEVTVYRDGRRRSGTWERSSASAPMRLRDAAGRDLTLRPGRTWLTLQG